MIRSKNCDSIILKTYRYHKNIMLIVQTFSEVDEFPLIALRLEHLNLLLNVCAQTES